jgi:hypothetical protein
MVRVKNARSLTVAALYCQVLSQDEFMIENALSACKKPSQTSDKNQFRSTKL